MFYLAMAVCAVAAVWHFRENLRVVVERLLDHPGASGRGAGLLAATILTFETVQSLTVYAFVAPTAVALSEYNDLEARVMRDIGANVSDEQMNADLEALNRSAAKLQALGRMGSGFVTH